MTISLNSRALSVVEALVPRAEELRIAFHPIEQTLAPYKVPGEFADRLAKAQQLLINSI